MKIGQVEKKDREQSLNGGRSWERRSVNMLKETRVVVLIEGGGGHEDGEVSRSQIIRILLCHIEKFKLHPAGKGE